MSKELTPWQQYKKNIGSARPWHMLVKDNYVDSKLSDYRYSICSSCPEFSKNIKVCKKCGCLMKNKVKLKQAECPIKKW